MGGYFNSYEAAIKTTLRCGEGNFPTVFLLSPIMISKFEKSIKAYFRPSRKQIPTVP